MRTELLAAAIIAALPPTTAVAHASPEDPYGDDYIAVAVSPATGGGGYGASGTMDDATHIALLQCHEYTGSECVIATAIHHGCVSLATNIDGQWRGGRGPDEAAARADAIVGLPAATVLGAWCST
jgi:hypothetical protein